MTWIMEWDFRAGYASPIGGTVRGTGTGVMREGEMANSRGFLKRRPTKGNEKAVVDSSEVARVAYGLYEQGGRQDGRAFDDWLEAEDLVRQQHGKG